MSDRHGIDEPRMVELLLVEDSFGDAMLAREAFAASPTSISLSIAVSGEEAMERLANGPHNSEHQRPDLILLDLSLPKMDGKAVLKAIKGNPDTRAIPVIMLTGSSAECDVRECYFHGANGYLVKPMQFERLQEIVAAIETFWLDAALLPAQPAKGTPHAA
jgi:CheY-like chemotaxis protein